MPRRACLTVPGFPLHIVRRGNRLAYRALFETPMTEVPLGKIRQSANHGSALGSDVFVEAASEQRGRARGEDARPTAFRLRENGV